MLSFIPKEYYLDQQIFQPITQKIVDSTWSCLPIDLSSLKENDCIPIEHHDTPLVLSYSKNKVNLLSNVCTHRAHILINRKKNTNCIKCPYHGRQFNLDGSCQSSPGFEKEEIKIKKNDLKKLSTYNFLDLCFYSIKPLFQLSSIFNQIQQTVNFVNHNNLIYEKGLSKTFVYNFNWALYCENYLEGLHIPFVHKGLAKQIKLSSYKTIVENNFVLQIAEAHKNNDAFQNSKIGAYYFWIFPGIMLNYYPWGLSINIIRALEVQKTQVQYFVYKFPGAIISNNDAGVLNVEKEDQLAVESVQKGLKSVLYTGPTLSRKYEKGVKKFHKLILNYF